jgi:fatty acid-binding protein DegV
MRQVAVVTDSVADIPPELAEELAITVVPLVLRFDTEVFRDSVDINPDEFYGKLTTAKILPKTSSPPPLAFSEIFDRLAEKTDSILYIGLTSKLSGTFQIATQSLGLMKNPCRVDNFWIPGGLPWHRVLLLLAPPGQLSPGQVSMKRLPSPVKPYPGLAYAPLSIL